MSLAEVLLSGDDEPRGGGNPSTRRRTGSAAGSSHPLELAVVTPTFNESGNIPELIRRIGDALDDVRWEAIIVDDDSPDGTARVARSIGAFDQRVRVIRRIGRRGLSSACIEGMLSSGAEVFAVIDADLQHDPAVLAAMLADMQRQDADVVVASRYMPGGGIGGWTASRSKLSRFATQAAQAASGLKLTDPMSGCFLIRRTALESRAAGLSGRGFKILLDILMTPGAPLKIVETPLVFAPRLHGESKLSARVLWDAAVLLIGKALALHMPARILAFGAVGASGVLVQLLALSVLKAWADFSFPLSQALAVAVAMLSNFLLNDRATFSHARQGVTLSRMGRFFAVCLFGAAVNLMVAQIAIGGLGDWRLASLIGVGAGAVSNFLLSTLLVWPDRASRG